MRHFGIGKGREEGRRVSDQVDLFLIEMIGMLLLCFGAGFGIVGWLTSI